MTKTILVLRHSIKDVKGEKCDWFSVLLSKEGVELAGRVGEIIQRQFNQVTKVFHSHFPRCKQTAEILARILGCESSEEKALAPSLSQDFINAAEGHKLTGSLTMNDFKEIAGEFTQRESRRLLGIIGALFEEMENDTTIIAISHQHAVVLLNSIEISDEAKENWSLKPMYGLIITADHTTNKVIEVEYFTPC